MPGNRHSFFHRGNNRQIPRNLKALRSSADEMRLAPANFRHPGESRYRIHTILLPPCGEGGYPASGRGRRMGAVPRERLMVVVHLVAAV